MGTRSRIGIIEPNSEEVRSIYCHWDGYPSYNGKILLNEYRTPTKVRKLIRLGDISSLRKNVSTKSPHNFEKPDPNTTIAYKRDRGETDTDSRFSPNLDEFRVLARQTDAEYVYVYSVAQRQWYWAGGDEQIQPLQQADVKK